MFVEYYNEGKFENSRSATFADALKLLEKNIRKRFAWGLPVNIYPPELEIRKKIIKDKIK